MDVQHTNPFKHPWENNITNHNVIHISKMFLDIAGDKLVLSTDAGMLLLEGMYE